MTTPCPHCQAEIEIDPTTLAAPAGKNHFACPACQGTVAMPARPQMPMSAHRGLNRNFLILGSAALLVLGGLGFFLASQKPGDTTSTSQNIRNEIINNSYFTQLIASKATTKLDLEKLALIRPCEEGFWGLSEERFDWQQAQQIAARCGARICGGGDSMSCWPNMIKSMESEFSNLLPTTVWILKENQADIGSFGKSQIPVTQLDRSADSLHRVLLYWDTSKAVDHSLPWVHEEIPPPDKDGWITLFDGTHLHGVSRGVVRGKTNIGVENGSLWLDRRMLTFNVSARNVTIRADVKKLSGQNLALRCRSVNEGRYLAWFNGGASFGIGMNYLNPDYNYRDISNAKSSRAYEDFVDMELTAYDQKLSLKAGGEILIYLNDPTHTHYGAVVISALKGRSMFRMIQVKIHD